MPTKKQIRNKAIPIFIARKFAEILIILIIIFIPYGISETFYPDLCSGSGGIFEIMGVESEYEGFNCSSNHFAHGLFILITLFTGGFALLLLVIGAWQLIKSNWRKSLDKARRHLNEN